MSDPDVLASFAITLNVMIRPCRREDLQRLEWFGWFYRHRETIRETFEQQERGRAVILVADANGYPVGQVWINLALMREEGVGALWAVRVFPTFYRQGIGARLIEAAERLLRERGYTQAELGVERDNPDGRRFYERLGYRVVETARGEYACRTPSGETGREPLDEWIMRKRLVPEDGNRQGPF